MRVAILSTDTKHHRYCIQKLAEHVEIALVLYERRRLAKPYPTGPFFAEEESSFEERFFDPAWGGTPREFPPELERRVVLVHDANQPGVAEHLRAVAPDLGVVFGTGPLAPPVFTSPRWGCINVHRGLTQHHRGLDSDLWAMLEGRFDAIGVTIHAIEPHLDTGRILAQETTPIAHGDEIFHLRYKTTVQATRMLLEVLARFADRPEAALQELPSGHGPYYTAMDLERKHLAHRNFLAYRETLHG